MSYPQFPFPEASGEFPEEDNPVRFFSEDIAFELGRPAEISAWLQEVIAGEKCKLHGLSFIFCSDEYLYRLNVDFLEHDTYTDVITFPYAEPPLVEGDIYISVDRVRENAETFKSGFENELHRVLVHGVLHLCGYGDKTQEQERLMREKESQYLEMLVARR